MDPGEPVKRSVCGPQLNVSLGREFADHLGVGTGDKVYLMANPDRPGTVVILSMTTMMEIIEKGWRSTSG